MSDVIRCPNRICRATLQPSIGCGPVSADTIRSVALDIQSPYRPDYDVADGRKNADYKAVWEKTR